MEKPLRPSADATRKKILKAAQAVFLEHGFDGAKTQMIAKQAKVNSNLVFHHFKNKETLWLKVKEFIVGECIEPPQYDLSSARAYFKSVLDYRFKLYQDNPTLVKLMRWQALTEKSDELAGSNFASPICWLKDIKELQKRGEITKSVDANLIMLFIIYSSHAPFMQSVVTLSKAKVEQYKEIVLSACLGQFS